MLSLDHLTQIESILSSDRVTIKGNEAPGYVGLLQQIHQERQMLIAARQKAQDPTTAPVRVRSIEKVG